MRRLELKHTFAANAIHLDVRSPLLSILVVIIPNLHDSMNLTRSWTFSGSSGSVRFVALYGSAGLSSGIESVLLKCFCDAILKICVVNIRLIDGSFDRDWEGVRG